MRSNRSIDLRVLEWLDLVIECAKCIPFGSVLYLFWCALFGIEISCHTIKWHLNVHVCIIIAAHT